LRREYHDRYQPAAHRNDLGGYRFRSRLEARWAVFFDAAEIEWEYEPDGFSLAGRNYLPDFWLPQLAAFVEVKPTEEAGRQAIPPMKELATKTRKTGLLLIGSPNLHHEPYKLINIAQASPQHSTWLGRELAWHQCLFCNKVFVDTCDCIPAVKVLHRPEQRSRLIDRALLEAQRARFEHGEDGRPQPYRRDDSTLPYIKVYVAGAVLEKDDDCSGLGRMLQWRCDIFGETDVRKFNADAHLCDGRFQYAGPSIIECHGFAQEDLGIDCITEVKRSDAVFIWFDRTDTIGTLIETGAAFGAGKALFVAFATHELARELYFARQLATVAIVARDAVTAWRVFKNWQNQ
jgi:hypothetical protein